MFYKCRIKLHNNKYFSFSILKPDHFPEMALKKPLRSFTTNDWLRIWGLSILLFLVFLFNNNTNFVLPGEEGLATKMDVLTEMILPSSFHPPHDFVFINTAKDLELVKDENGGDNVITDRAKLGSLLKLLADSNRHSFLLCDIVFDLPSPEDSVFREDIKGLQKALFPRHAGDTANLFTGFSLPEAYADYYTNTGKFSKFRLINGDSGKTLPLVLYEKMHGVCSEKKFGFLVCDNKICFQTISPVFYIRPYHLNVSKTYPCFNLGELLLLSADPSFYGQFLANRFIVIGNFDTDVHATPVGSMPGTLILLNTYLGLVNGLNQPGILWFLFMFIVFFLINLHLIHGEISPPRIGKKSWWSKILNNLLIRLFSLGFLCLGIDLLSQYIFGVRCQLLSIVFFILVVNFLLDLSRPN